MAKPLISVVVPTFSKVKLLADCLASVREQSHRDLECIVVDDGSPHGGEIREVVFAQADPRFFYLRLEANSGPGAARNAGARIAKGDWIIFVDEDDFLAPCCLEKLLGEAVRNGADVVSPWLQKVGGESGLWRPRRPPSRESAPDMYVAGAGVLISRQLWERVGGYDESSEILGREDYEFWVRALRMTDRVFIVEEPLYFYRKCGNELSLSSSTKMREVSVRKAIVRKHKDLYAAFPVHTRHFLAEGYYLQASAHMAAQKWFLGIVYSLLAYCYVPSKKRFKFFLKCVIAGLATMCRFHVYS